MKIINRSWAGALLGAALAMADVSSTKAQAVYPGCEELGAALVDHACFHATMGPFASVTASATRDFAAATPNINPVHTHYTIALPAGSEGTVKYRPQRTGAWTIMTDPNTSLTVLDAGGASRPVLLEGAVPSCAGLPYQRVYELQANATYRLVLGPTGGDEVAVVIEKLSDFETAYFADADGDSFGDTNSILSTACNQPDGHVTDESDCDDSNASVNPGESEACGDNLDNNCNGQVDEDCGPVCTPVTEICDEADNDCDGQVDEGVKNACGECGDVPAEVCSDNIDNDCDGQTNEGCPPVCEPTAEVCDGMDNDCDGQVDDGVLNACGQCGDVPSEACGDGVDNDCDGQADEDCGPVCVPTEEVCDSRDNDCDSEVDEGVLNACGACGEVPAELCNDQIDNDCDGQTNEGCPPVCEPSEEVCDGTDNDCDGAVDNGVLNACGECGEVPSEECGDGADNDCDGTADEDCPDECVPSAEVCDGVDNDCDGLVDEDVQNACGTCGDVPAEACDDQIDNDCDGLVNEDCGTCEPTEEVCDGTDNDCDGEIDRADGKSVCSCGSIDLKTKRGRKGRSEATKKFDPAVTVAIPAEVQVTGGKGRGGKVTLTFGTSSTDNCGGVARKTFSCSYAPGSKGGQRGAAYRLKSCEGNRAAGDAVEVDFLRLRVNGGNGKNDRLQASVSVQDLSCQ